VPEQVCVGLLAAVVLALADVLLTVGSAGLLTDAGAALHLFALYLPAGLVVGLGSAAVVGLVRATPALQGLRKVFAPRLWFVPQPHTVAAMLGGLTGLGVVALLTRLAYVLLVTRTHRIDLAAWTMAGVSIGILVLGVLAGALVRGLLRRPLRWGGPLARPGFLLGALLVVGAIAFALVLRARPVLVEVYTLPRLLFPPAAFLVLFALTFAVRRVLPRGRRGWLLLAVVVPLAIGAWVLSGLTYRGSNRVRAVVEQQSVWGRLLLRRYAALTDIDRDGHAWAFGGRDCNDLDPGVHPGARDVEGDGIDADCFHGDGSPDVADLSTGEYGARPRALPRRPNFILVTIDALRPDHLGHMGYERSTSPEMDAFARDAVVFTQARSPSSRSIRSIPSMMTGRYPSQLAYGPEYLFPSLMPENRTVAEVLGGRGYETAVTMGTNYFERVGGFFQGFDDVVQTTDYKPRREATVDRALGQLRGLAEQGRPFFQWVHLFHVHQPYLRPAAPSAFGPEAVDAYDTEIRFADQELGRLLDAIDELELRSDTVVILASDHGEAFLEHGQWGHASTVYEEELISALVIRVPGVEARRVDGPVSLLDLYPTLLNLADIPISDPVPARSLVPLLTGEREALDPARYLFAELMPDGMFPYDIQSIRQGDLKLHWWVQDGTYQLFDLAADPGEREDLSDAQAARAEELLGLLQAWSAQTGRAENRTEEYIERQRLRAPPPSIALPLDLSVPGAFEILGVDFEDREYHPGETIPLTFFYRVQAGTSLDLFFRVNLEGPEGYVVPPHFHGMHFPLRGRYRTTEWQAGEILRDPVTIVVPPNLQVPVDLRLSLSIQVADSGLIRMRQGTQTLQQAELTTIRLRPASPDLSPALGPRMLPVPTDGPGVLQPAPAGGAPAGDDRPWPTPPREGS
jgi:arylsulfatase A-like enzyme